MDSFSPTLGTHCVNVTAGNETEDEEDEHEEVKVGETHGSDATTPRTPTRPTVPASSPSGKRSRTPSDLDATPRLLALRSCQRLREKRERALSCTSGGPPGSFCSILQSSKSVFVSFAAPLSNKFVCESAECGFVAVSQAEINLHRLTCNLPLTGPETSDEVLQKATREKRRERKRSPAPTKQGRDGAAKRKKANAADATANHAVQS